MTTQVTLPDWPWHVVRRVARERRRRVWVVGGAVRDALLGRPVHDWDFAVDGGGMELARAVADALGGAYFPLDAERDAGRVVLTPEDGPIRELDFAALRGPDLEADLRGRDFTINALALDEKGALFDPTGGRTDLEAGRVRATSAHAFRDDPVRLLRAARMEAGLGFEIEPRTEAWLRRDAARVSPPPYAEGSEAAPIRIEGSGANPSAERVRDELARLMAMRGAAGHVRRLDELGLLSHVVPELESLKGVAQSPPHRFDVWRHTLLVVDTLEGVTATATGRDVPQASPADAPAAAWGELARVLTQFAEDVTGHLAVEVSGRRDRALLLKIAALLHDVGKPETRSQDEDGRIHFYNHEPVGAEMARARLRRLRFSGDEIERAGTVVRGHLRPAHLARADTITRRAVYRYFRALGGAGVEVVLLSLADHLATWGPHLRELRWARRLETAETLLTHYFERHEETVAPPPLLTGHELMRELGLRPGPEVGRLLEAIREAQAAGEVGSPEEALALARRAAA